MQEVLRIQSFRRLLVAYTLNELAWAIGSLSLALLVYRRTGSAVGAMAYFLSAQFIPALIAPALVARLDQRGVRRVLPVLYSLEALAFLMLAGLVSRFSVAPVLVLTIADGVLALSARPLARATAVGLTAPAGLLREGNALTNASFSICYLTGPAIGALVVVLGGTSAALLVNSGLFIAIALTIATARGLPDGSRQPERGAGRLRAALAHARTRPPIRTIIVLQFTAVLIFTIAIPVEVVFAQHSLHAGTGGYGALLSAWGGGAVLGSLVYARWRRLPSRVLVALGAITYGAGMLIMALAGSLPVAVAGSAVAGVANGLEAVAARTALQEQVEQPWMALMMSLNESIFQAVPGGGILIGGAIAALSGPRAALAVAGCGSLVIAAAAWVVLGPESAPVQTAERAEDRGSIRRGPRPTPATRR